MAAPTAVPIGPATVPTAAPAAIPPAAAPTPTPTGCAPGAPVSGSRLGVPVLSSTVLSPSMKVSFVDEHEAGFAWVPGVVEVFEQPAFPLPLQHEPMEAAD